jgi:hypothetical protein
MSHSLLLQRKTYRLARDSLRRFLWAVWIWTQQINPEPLVSRFQSVVEGLPRHLLEHEKALILTLAQAFGLESAHSDLRSPSTDSATASSTNSPQRSSSGMTEIFLKFYIRSFSAMKRFISWNPKATGISSSSSTNLFLTASANLVPAEEMDRILARVFSVSEPEGKDFSWQHFFVHADRPVPSDLQTALFSGHRPERRIGHALFSGGYRREVLVELPPFQVSATPLLAASLFLNHRSIALKIRDDLILLTSKNAGVSADAFDVILTMWSHLKRYRDSLAFVLEVLVTSDSTSVVFLLTHLAFPVEGAVSLLEWLRGLSDRSHLPHPARVHSRKKSFPGWPAPQDPLFRGATNPSLLSSPSLTVHS